MLGLARNLCWHQFGTYAAAGPYGETTAKLALQPLINLARLCIRDGDHAGYQNLQSLYNAARSPEEPAVIDGRTIDIATLIAPAARETITEWLWAVLLTDGLRALCHAGRWTDVVRQARQHDGIGKRLLGGRQIAILALAADGHGEEAGRLLRETDATEPWERAVAACLRALIHDPDGETPSPAPAEMTRDCLTLDDLAHPTFTACLNLTAAELTEPSDGQSAATGEAIRIATRSRDGYIAREIITSPVMPIVPEEALAHLRDIVHQSGLGRPLTDDQSRRLEDSAWSASAALAAGIRAS